MYLFLAFYDTETEVRGWGQARLSSRVGPLNSSIWTLSPGQGKHEGAEEDLTALLAERTELWPDQPDTDFCHPF